VSWLWDIDDFDTRIAFAREFGPSDFLTLMVRVVISRSTNMLTVILGPVNQLMKILGHGLIAVVLGMLVLIVIHGLWFIVWLWLIGSSWLWLNHPWSRPILVIPGILFAISGHVFLILVPDPHKNPKYNLIAQDWPLSVRLWHPTEAYFEAYPYARL
tara:strand:+ start:646 stop:1116 length:471 start_codon:yes stop_codon:yes gene_type:complete